ncbi:hypothetical protein [Pedobacter nutrimenti]|jgi:hypothetical protein|uniref:Outer membrane protein with beta-barrel domain n=1 Tax=Pedobacter nutrimenti TaxID=1241337 RepID=A0A318ULD1_9SPHI|nr:hypothetical protein [Pedobacter nutrimenti]PYF77256.1 hypothetical protein B0O44_101737 [Pedobacter nutrimenti]
METPDKKELIEEISALFHAHEEIYEQGAWENFVKEKKKKRILLPWIGVAAALLLVCSVVPFVWKKDFASGPEMVKGTLKHPIETLPKTAAPGPVDLGTRVTAPKTDPSGVESTVAVGQVFAKNKNVTTMGKVKQGKALHEYNVMAKAGVERSLIAAAGTVKPANDQIVQEGKPVETRVKTAAVPEKNTDAQQAIAQNTKNPSAAEEKQQKKEKDFLDFLKAESRKKELAAQKDKAKEAKWSFGLDVSPGLMQSKLSMSGGFSTELKLAGKFSLSSGISYTALNAGNLPSAGNPSLNSASPDGGGSAAYSLTSSNTTIKRKLVSIDARIRAIDVPVSLVYHLNKKMYVSAGISYFGVFSEERNTNYTTETIQNKTYQDLSTGQIRTAEQVVTGESKSVSETTPLKGNSYIGFFNFSTGRKQQISPKNYLILEPFIKVPIGKLSQDELRLTNGGLRLKLTF